MIDLVYQKGVVLVTVTNALGTTQTTLNQQQLLEHMGQCEVLLQQMMWDRASYVYDSSDSDTLHLMRKEGMSKTGKMLCGLPPTAYRKEWFLAPTMTPLEQMQGDGAYCQRCVRAALQFEQKRKEALATITHLAEDAGLYD